LDGSRGGRNKAAISLLKSQQSHRKPETAPMNRPDEAAAKGETAKRESAGAAADLGDKLVNKLFASREDLPRASHQSKPAEDLNTLLLRISHRLDYEHAERRTIDYRLVAIEGQMKAIGGQAKRRASRSFIRYLVAICVGVAGTLAWQSYVDEARQTIATTVPELGWNPEVRQMIASWTKALARSENTAARPSASETEKANTAPETVPPSAPAVPPFDPEQAKQMTRSLDALRQAVEGLAAVQDQVKREMTSLQAADAEILAKIQALPRAPPIAPARNPAPVLPPRRVPLTSAAPRP
jgi:hypothetical protein